MQETTRSRRRVLRAIGATLGASGAGCLGSGGTGAPTTATPDGSATTAAGPSVETPRPGDCEPVRPSGLTPGRDGLEPKPYPDLPAEPTADDAASFAQAFERAYVTNAVLAGTSSLSVPDGLDDLGFYDVSTDVRAVDAGRLVTVTYSVTYEDRPGDEATVAGGGTASPAPTGHRRDVSVEYVVTGSSALRRAGAWVVVACG